jgi:Xaa-Pro aminopeptidase
MIDKRLKNFREEMKVKGIDGAFIFNDINRNYITGFTGNESYIIITQKEAVFITDSRYTEQAAN